MFPLSSVISPSGSYTIGAEPYSDASGSSLGNSPVSSDSVESFNDAMPIREKRGREGDIAGESSSKRFDMIPSYEGSSFRTREEEIASIDPLGCLNYPHILERLRELSDQLRGMFFIPLYLNPEITSVFISRSREMKDLHAKMGVQIAQIEMGNENRFYRRNELLNLQTEVLKFRRIYAAMELYQRHAMVIHTLCFDSCYRPFDSQFSYYMRELKTHPLFIEVIKATCRPFIRKSATILSVNSHKTHAVVYNYTISIINPVTKKEKKVAEVAIKMFRAVYADPAFTRMIQNSFEAEVYSLSVLSQVDGVAELIFAKRPKLDKGEVSYEIVTKKYFSDIAHEMQNGNLLKSKFFHHYLPQLLSAVKSIHAHGIVHSNLKPANFFITEDQQLKIGDFALATECGKKPAGGNGLYNAPEVTEWRADGNLHVRHEAKAGYEQDVWSIGMIVLIMIDPSIKRHVYKQLMHGMVQEDMDAICKFVLISKTDQFFKYNDPEKKRDGILKKVLERTLRIDPRQRVSVNELLLLFRI
ncbi:MAG: protein kinase [Simkaniaceae bacterium]|nr:protein kinase [Simkaniaceae bacterium]